MLLLDKDMKKLNLHQTLFLKWIFTHAWNTEETNFHFFEKTIVFEFFINFALNMTTKSEICLHYSSK
jgi:hypothetical protein